MVIDRVRRRIIIGEPVIEDEVFQRVVVARKWHDHPERLDRVARLHVRVKPARGHVVGEWIAQGLAQFVAEDEEIRHESLPGSIQIGLVGIEGGAVISARKAGAQLDAIKLSLARVVSEEKWQYVAGDGGRLDIRLLLLW